MLKLLTSAFIRVVLEIIVIASRIVKQTSVEHRMLIQVSHDWEVIALWIRFND